jgi:predicted ATPase/DNA-binding CsgD family transcriptional regulator
LRLPVHRFPVWLSRFIGREKEKAEVKSLLECTRLLTITGPGGCGKTRLALEVAQDLSYPDGIWLVELASLSSGEAIPQSTGYALGLTENPNQSFHERLLDHMEKKNLLLVLDNCEHLVEHCAKFVHDLLAACPDLHIVATSREPLHIEGETTWPMPPLSLPEWQAGMPLKNILQSEAIELFLDRARLVWPGFTVNAQNASDVVKICHQLDGIPLALELAAGRMNILSVQEMAGRMDNTVLWLSGVDRFAPPRQQTLKATLDWSYALLQEDEQRFFRRLAVFDGGFTLQAVEAVCIGDGIALEQSINLLARLIDKSFVVNSLDYTGIYRYRLLEVVRQYALDQLRRSDEETVIRTRHLNWCLSIAKDVMDRFLQADSSGWSERIDLEVLNLRQAFTWSQSGAVPIEIAYLLASNLWQFWQARGFYREGLAWYQALLNRTDGVAADVLARSYHNAGGMAQHLHDFELAMEYSKKARELYRQGGDWNAVAQEMCFIGWIYERMRQYTEAQRMAEEALALFQNTKSETGNEDYFGISIARLLLGDLAFLQGDYEEAMNQVAESLALCQKSGNILGVNRRRTRLAHAWISKGDLVYGCELLRESIQASRGTGDRWITVMILSGLILLETAQARWLQAAQCLGAANAFHDEFGAQFWPVDQLIFEKHQTLVQLKLDESSFVSAGEKGLAIGTDVNAALDFAWSSLKALEKDLQLDVDKWDASVTVDAAAVKAAHSAKRVARTANQVNRQAYDGLTTREREVAALIAKGKSNAQIANDLYLGIRTIEAHVTKIMNRLGYNSRTQIAIWADRKGLR